MPDKKETAKSSDYAPQMTPDMASSIVTEATPQKRKPLFDRITDSYHQLKEEFAIVIDKANNLGRTNYELGIKHMNAGHITDAILRFRIVLWLDPKYYLAWYHLGCCQLTKGQADKAAQSFLKSLELKPGLTEAKFMLAMADPTKLPQGFEPKVMPLSIILHYFNSVAQFYDREQVETMGYKGHEITAETLKEYHAEEEDEKLSILDLGCGSGLAGPLLKPMADSLIGVDIVKAMVDEAKKKQVNEDTPVYDEVVEADLQQYIDRAKGESVDVIVMTNVAGYIGDLDALFLKIAQTLKPKGILIMTADKFGGEGYGVHAILGRFGHARTYLRQVPEQYGLEAKKVEEIKLYENLEAFLCVYQRA
jgi:predicted TPR repeat methyltransferase